MAALVFLGDAIGGAPLLGWLFKVLGLPSTRSVKQVERASVWIGVLERTLLILLAVPDGLQAVPWVLAAKTVARFPSIEGKEMPSEKYIIGTLVSTSLATVGVLIIRAIFGLPLVGAHTG